MPKPWVATLKDRWDHSEGMEWTPNPAWEDPTGSIEPTLPHFGPTYVGQEADAGELPSTPLMANAPVATSRRSLRFALRRSRMEDNVYRNRVAGVGILVAGLLVAVIAFAAYASNSKIISPATTSTAVQQPKASMTPAGAEDKLTPSPVPADSASPSASTTTEPTDGTSSECMPLEDAQAIFDNASGNTRGKRINGAIVAFNKYVVEHPDVKIYSDTEDNYRAWRDGQLPQEATVIVWTDLAGEKPTVLTPADAESKHTLATDFIAVKGYTQGGWGFYIVYGPVMMPSPFGGALMCGQFDNPGSTPPVAPPANPAVPPTNPVDDTCLQVKDAKKLFKSSSSIDDAIKAFDAYVKDHPTANLGGAAGTTAWPSDTSIMKSNATVIVWTDLQGKQPKVLTSGHTLKTDFIAVKGFRQGGWGFSVVYGPVEMPTGFGGVLLCGQFDN